MSRVRPTNLRQIALGLLMVLPALSAVNLAGAFPITGEQQATLDQFGPPLLPGAPFGQWDAVQALDTFYLHSDVLFDTPGGDVGGTIGDVGGGTPPVNLTEAGRPLPLGAHVYLTDLRRPQDNTLPVNGDPTPLNLHNARTIPLASRNTEEAVFILPLANRALDDIHVYSLQARMFAAGLGAGGAINVDVYDDDGVDAVHFATIVLVPDLDPVQGDSYQQGSLAYSGVATVGVRPFDRNFETQPYLVERGHMIQLRISAQAVRVNLPGDDTVPTDFPVLYLDTQDYPSSWSLLTDAARINLWTENRVRQVVDVFPPVTEANTQDRRVHLKALHFNAWGNHEPGQDGNPAVLGREECYLPSPPGSQQSADDCPRDNLDQASHALRILDITPDHDTYLDYVPLDQGIGRDPLPSVGCCSPLNNPQIDHPIEYTRIVDQGIADPADRGLGLLQYTFTYGQEHQDKSAFLPGRYRIELYEVNKAWSSFKDITIGELGFDFRLAAGEVASHTVAQGQPTDYIFSVFNRGGGTDTFGVSVAAPGDGWTATVAPSLLSLAPGAEGRVTVTVTPASGGPFSSAGSAKIVRVDAVSLFNNLVKSQTVTTVITGTLTDGVELSSVTPLIEGRPGSTQAIPIGIRNTGTRAGTYLVTAEADDAELAAGWTFSLTPNYLPLRAASRQDLLLQVFAPPEAEPGTSFTLRVHAGLSTATEIGDTLDLVVGVLIQDRLATSVLDGNERVWRDIAAANPDPVCGIESTVSSTCEAGDERYYDVDFDDGAVFRVRIENQGDREDDYILSASWVGSENTVDNNCEGSGPGGDGVPDGWRFLLARDIGPADGSGPFDVVSTMAAPGGPQRSEVEMGHVTLPAHTVADAYVIAWTLEPSDNGCANDADFTGMRGKEPSPESRLRFTARSQNDPNLREVEFLTSTLEDRANVVVNTRGNSPGQRFSVAVEPAISLTPGLQVYGVPEATEKRVLPGGFVDYRMRAINTGNEHDGMTIGVQAGSRGWRHAIVPNSWIIVNTTESVPHQADPSPAERRCILTPLGTLSCEHMGVYDEVHFTLRATPPIDARVGDEDVMTVTVGSSQGGGGIQDSADLVSEVTSLFIFDLQALNPVLSGERGQTLAFPYTIRNIGLAADTYQVSVVTASTSWGPALSSAPQVTVPGGRNFHGFLSVNVPQNVAPGHLEFFRMQVQSLAPAGFTSGQPTKVLDFFAEVNATTQLRLFVEPRTVLSGAQPTESTFRVVAIDDRRAAGEIQFDVDIQTLPRGWTLACGGDPGCQTSRPQTDVREFAELDLDGDGTVDELAAVGDYTVVVPPGELGASRVIVRVCGRTDDERRSCHDAVLNLQSTYGVSLPEGPLEEVVAAGIATEHTIRVENTGLTAETVSFTMSSPPAGWVVAPLSSIALQPGEVKEINVSVTAPATASEGDQAVILLTATVAGQPLTDVVTLITRVGFFQLDLKGRVVGDDPGRAFVAPLETASFLLNVTHAGDLPEDEALLRVSLPAAYGRILKVEWGPGCDEVTTDNECRLRLKRSLDPNATDPQKQVRLDIDIPADLVPNLAIEATVLAESVLAKAYVPEQVILGIQVLPYAAQDVDQDGGAGGNCTDPGGCPINEYAVDRNRDPADGFEQFLDLEPNGIRTRPADLVRFLSDEALARKTVVVTLDDGSDAEVLRYVIDGDQDGRTDHFLDTTQDGLPDLYWDPDLRAVSVLAQTKDVNNDGVREYFIDLDKDGRLDAWFDIIAGEFGELIQLFVNEDNILDYVVDLDGDGIADPGEPVLIGSALGLGAIASIIQQVDMNGDGKLDTVVDEDGDGDPDYFIPNGQTASIPITLEDVTGDGVADWTYPSKGEGRPDSYYDPVEGKAGFIDTRSQFVQELEKYWYIGVLFLLVLILFVVLVAVTRR